MLTVRAGTTVFRQAAQLCDITSGIRITHAAVTATAFSLIEASWLHEPFWYCKLKCVSTGWLCRVLFKFKWIVAVSTARPCVFSVMQVMAVWKRRRLDFFSFKSSHFVFKYLDQRFAIIWSLRLVPYSNVWIISLVCIFLLHWHRFLLQWCWCRRLLL